MEYPYIVSDEVFPMNYAAGVVMAARMRVVAFSSSEAGVIFSQPSQGRGPVRPPAEFHPEGNPEFLERLFLEMADNAQLDWGILPPGMTIRWFIRWDCRQPVSKSDATFSKMDTTFPGRLAEIVFEDLPVPEPPNLIQFPTAPSVRRTRRAAPLLKAVTQDAGLPELVFEPDTGCPFRTGDVLKVSTVGELSVFEKQIRTTVVRPLVEHQIIVKIDGRERCCPTSWFALDIKPLVLKESAPPKVLQPEFAVGDVVQFQSSGLGLPFYPMARVLAVLPPGEDPVTILAGILPDWRKTHRLGSAAVRLGSGANVFRYWVEADPVPESNRGRRPRPRLFLKREDWIWKKEG